MTLASKYDMKGGSPHLAKRALQLFKDYGLRYLLCAMIRKMAQVCISALDRISLPKLKEGHVVKEILGSKMYLDLADEGISRDLIIDGIRERISVEVVTKELKSGDIVVDIGANIGYYVLLESKLVGDKGKIYAIEPDPSNVELLEKNIEINGLSNVEVFQHAIGDSNDIHSMHLFSERNLGTLMDIAGTSKEELVTGNIEVKTLTLDDFLENKPYPNLIRMDVEGYEYQIIRGMKNILQRNLPLTLFIDFHFHLLKRQESVEILNTLKSAGFRIAYMAKEVRQRGQCRHKLLSSVIRLVEPTILKEFNHVTPGRYLDLSIDDILSTPAILDNKSRGLSIFFKRG
jgi:FkbM family methyltransferase